ncbi:MAG TPA: hypothetical protein VGE74_30900 [Gemmata sp.]
MPKPKPKNPPALQAAGESALDAVAAALAAEGLGRLAKPITRAGLQIISAPVKKPKTCEGCPDVPPPVAERAESVQRVYLIIRSATEANEFMGPKEIVKRSRSQKEGPIPPRTVGRALNVLRTELGLIHFVAGSGYRLGSAPSLF